MPQLLRKKTSVSVLGVDTNVLIRFLTDDDAVQSPQAQRVMTAPDNQPIYVNLLVLVEAYNVMTKVKKHGAAAVLDAYRQMLLSPGMEIERADLVGIAIEQASVTRAGFADALIALQNAEAGCRTTLTFDRRAMRLADMRPVEDFL